MKEAVDMDRLEADEPVSGVAAVHLLYGLGLDDGAVRANWRKLAGRPAGQVRALVANLEGERPELAQTRITEFAKKTGRIA